MVAVHRSWICSRWWISCKRSATLSRATPRTRHGVGDASPDLSSIPPARLSSGNRKSGWLIEISGMLSSSDLQTCDFAGVKHVGAGSSRVGSTEGIRTCSQPMEVQLRPCTLWPNPQQGVRAKLPGLDEIFRWLRFRDFRDFPTRRGPSDFRMCFGHFGVEIDSSAPTSPVAVWWCLLNSGWRLALCLRSLGCWRARSMDHLQPLRWNSIPCDHPLEWVVVHTNIANKNLNTRESNVLFTRRFGWRKSPRKIDDDDFNLAMQRCLCCIRRPGENQTWKSSKYRETCCRRLFIKAFRVKCWRQMASRKGRPANEQSPGFFTERTDRFVVDDDVDSDTVAESDMSFKNSYTGRTTECERCWNPQKIQCKTSTKVLWRMFTFSLFEAFAFMGKSPKFSTEAVAPEILLQKDQERVGKAITTRWNRVG